MSDHTPGPWAVKGAEGELLTVAMQHDKAWMHFCPSVSSFGYNATDEMRANAKLMALAPEMLAALEAAEHLYLHGILHTPAEQVERVQAMRRAVLAKATGA